MPPIARLSILGFLGGALAVLIFHQSLWYLFKSDRPHPARAACLAVRPHPALRRAVGDLKGVLGRRVGRGFGPPALAFAWALLLGRLDHRCGDCAAARCLLRGAADQGRADSGTLAAFPRLDDGQRHLGFGTALIPAARERGTERLRWRRSLAKRWSQEATRALRTPSTWRRACSRWTVRGRSHRR